MRGGGDDHRRRHRHARPAGRQEPARPPPATQRPTRLGMLETIRAYAAERFAAAADSEAVRERHYRYFLALAQRHGSDRALCGTSRKSTSPRLDAEIANLHAALEWAVGQDSAEPALAMCAALGEYWLMRDRYADAVALDRQALAAGRRRRSGAARPRARASRRWALWPLGRSSRTTRGHGGGRGDRQHAGRTRRSSSEVLYTRAVQESCGRAARCRRQRSLTRRSPARRCRRRVGDRDGRLRESAWPRPAPPSCASASTGPRRCWSGRQRLPPRGPVPHRPTYRALRHGCDRDARGVRRTRDRRSCANSTIPTCGCSSAATRAGRAARPATPTPPARRSARSSSSAASSSSCPSPPKAWPASPRSRQSATTSTAPRGSSGAAAAHRYGEPQDAVDGRLDATFLEPARARCGADAWDAAVREGAALSFEDAIAYALDE